MIPFAGKENAAECAGGEVSLCPILCLGKTEIFALVHKIRALIRVFLRKQNHRKTCKNIFLNWY
jgi:hypothetical protein